MSSQTTVVSAKNIVVWFDIQVNKIKLSTALPLGCPVPDSQMLMAETEADKLVKNYYLLKQLEILWVLNYAAIKPSLMQSLKWGSWITYQGKP